MNGGEGKMSMDKCTLVILGWVFLRKLYPLPIGIKRCFYDSLLYIQMNVSKQESIYDSHDEQERIDKTSSALMTLGTE